MSEKLTYEPYNKTKLAVRGDQQYDSIIKTLGGRWNSRMKGGPGWTIDINKEDQLKILLKNINDTFSTKDDNHDDDDDDDDDDDNQIVSASRDSDDDNQPSEHNSDFGDYRQSRSIREQPRRQHYEQSVREQPRRQYYEQSVREQPRRQHYEQFVREQPREQYYEQPVRHDNYRHQIPMNFMDDHYRQPREEFERGVASRYDIDDNVDRYYSKFTEKSRMKKNNNRQARQEEMMSSESESDGYDSDELESLSQTLNRLNKKVASIKSKRDKSRGRKHRRDRH